MEAMGSGYMLWKTYNYYVLNYCTRYCVKGEFIQVTLTLTLLAFH